MLKVYIFSRVLEPVSYTHLDVYKRQVTLYTIPDVFIITVASDMLNTTQLCNVAIRFFGKEGYTISTLGMLGPFKKCR